jgi:hypothetical protein
MLRYRFTSAHHGHPGISILSGLAIVGVTEPLALPWVALGTVTPFILGYRVLGGEVVASNAPEFIATTVSRTETFEMTMMSAGKSVPEHSRVVPNLACLKSIRYLWTWVIKIKFSLLKILKTDTLHFYFFFRARCSKWKTRVQLRS